MPGHRSYEQKGQTLLHFSGRRKACAQCMKDLAKFVDGGGCGIFKNPVQGLGVTVSCAFMRGVSVLDINQWLL